MSLLPLRRWPARHLEEPPSRLPAPGPRPIARPPQDAIVIIVVVLVAVIWLLAHGYSTATALSVVAGADAVAAAIVSRLVATRSAGD